MPLTPHQTILVTFEFLLLAVGAWILVRATVVPELRAAVFGQSRLTHWNVTGFEAFILALAIFMCGMFGQGLVLHFFRDAIEQSPDRAGLEVVAYGLGFHGVALLGWPLFFAGRRRAHDSYGSTPPEIDRPRAVGPRTLLWKSVTTLILVLPIVAVASLVWTTVLRLAGLPVEPQDLIGIFGNVNSPTVLIAMLLVACVVAPINEELLFRGVIFRFCRQRFGRAIALGVSGVLFGVLHGNWAGFLPLALLGVALAVAYEQSGDIRVPIIAHALFNLNTTVVVLAGISTT